MRKWLIESLFCTENGYPNRIDYNSLDIISGRVELPSEACIFRGSIGSAKQLSRQQNGNIALFLGNRPDSFDFGSFSKEINKFALNQRFLLQPLWFIREVYKKEFKEPFFLRSNSAWKTVCGQIIKNYEQLQKLEAPESTICVIAKSRPIEREFRFIIVDGKVISGSSYMDDEHRVEPGHELFFFAQTVVNQIREAPDLTYVLDCVYCEGRYYALELNSVTTAGWYSSDTAKCCEAIEHALALEDTGHDSEI